MSEVHTRWHDFVEKYNAGKEVLSGIFEGRLANGADYNGFDKTEFDTVLNMLAFVPLYSLTRETQEIVLSDATDKSLSAIASARADKLEHPAAIYEFDGPGNERNKTRFFVVVSERKKTLISPSEVIWHPYICTLLSLYMPLTGKHAGKSYACVYPWQVYARLMDEEHTKRVHNLDGASVHYAVAASPWFHDRRNLPKEDDALTQTLIDQASVGLRAALILSHMRGIEQEVVSVPKLNKKRAAARKPVIRDHTVVRLGYVYTRTGERVRYNPKAQQGIRGMYAVPTHYRRQRFGKGLSEVKRIEIKGYIANFDPSKEPPKPKVRVVKP